MLHVFYLHMFVCVVFKKYLFLLVWLLCNWSDSAY